MEKIGNKFILGITGGVGSGKSRILDILQKDYGFHVIQADQVASKMWYVYTSRENRLERLKANRGYTREKTLSIMDNQVSDEVFRSFCDSVIDNNKSLEETKKQIAALMQHI